MFVRYSFVARQSLAQRWSEENTQASRIRPWGMGEWKAIDMGHGIVVHSPSLLSSYRLASLWPIFWCVPDTPLLRRASAVTAPIVRHVPRHAPAEFRVPFSAIRAEIPTRSASLTVQGLVTFAYRSPGTVAACAVRPEYAILPFAFCSATQAGHGVISWPHG